MREACFGRPVESGVAGVEGVKVQACYALVVRVAVDFARDGQFHESQHVGF